MEEYINRNTLLQQIRLAANRTSLGETSPSFISSREVVSLIIDAPAEDVVGNDKWISVDERLPEDYIEVLVFAKYEFVELCYFNKSENIWVHGCGHFDGEDVTHWMPLPNPPQN